MNAYEQKQAARRARYEDRAEKASTASEATYQQARTMAEAIPFGQPILIGHHSETRDRNYRARIHNTFGKAFALHDKAKHYEGKAAAVGTGGISSDDHDAIEKLRAELADIEAAQDKMKAANRAIRRNNRDELAELGFSAQQIEELFTPDACRRVGFPSYALNNNSANARRIEQRIKQLERLKDRGDVEKAGAGYTYREDTTENRVMFEFPGKPDADTRALLKRHAFKWSPTRNAWVRQLTNAGIYAGQQVRAALDSVEG
ncbi:DUF3560 domain-containing protein [Candidatus Burkholderia verschuerenii]|uniref:DUF3560 domain-containing protein n=1 Tax=Candidatus Burkholderia verschuerenii TaxID=242163 RepID=UPI00067CA73B|nr:DUF3560 domain-containing protein [Candidatus Burkholderia verschuerenii]